MPASVLLLSKTKELRQAISAILAKWKPDQLYYKVEVLSCDQVKRQCKVRFEDKTEHIIDCENMHIQLNLEWLQDKYIVCSVCDNSASDHPNVIIVCDTCSQGFHVQCHKPNINVKYVEDENIDWSCSTCDEIYKLSLKQATKKPKLAKYSPKIKSPAKKPVRENPRKRLRQDKSKDAPEVEVASEKDSQTMDGKTEDASHQENLVVTNEIEVATSEGDEEVQKTKETAPETKDRRKRKVEIPKSDKVKSRKLIDAIDTNTFIEKLCAGKPPVAPA